MTFTEVKTFANGGGSGNNNNNNNYKDNKPKEKQYDDPKKYLYEKKLKDVLEFLQYNGEILEFKKIKDSYAITTDLDSMIIIYVTSDGMYVVTKLNPSSGGYEGAATVERPNAIICGPGIIRDAIDFVDRTVKDNPNIFKRLWDYYFRGAARFSDTTLTFSEVRLFDNNNKNKDKDKNKNKNKNKNDNKPKPTAHSTTFEKDLEYHLKNLLGKGLVIDYKKIGNSYAVNVTHDRAIFVYITMTGDFILSKFDKETGGYVGTQKPRQLNAIITGSKNFEKAFRTMIYKVRDNEGMMEKLFRYYFT